MLHQVFYPSNAPASHNCGSDVFGHDSATDRVRELFEPSNDAESLLFSIKMLGSFGFERFWCDVTTEGGQGIFL